MSHALTTTPLEACVHYLFLFTMSPLLESKHQCVLILHQFQVCYICLLLLHGSSNLPSSELIHNDNHCYTTPHLPPCLHHILAPTAFVMSQPNPPTQNVMTPPPPKGITCTCSGSMSSQSTDANVVKCISLLNAKENDPLVLF